MVKDKEPPDEPEDELDDEEEFDEQLERLIVKGRDVGVKPLQRIGRRALREMFDVFERTLGAFEGDEPKPKKKRKGK